ncbi:MAG: acyloxyacyl hydrolase [Anaeromyxobacteraceae bacterium]
MSRRRMPPRLAAAALLLAATPASGWDPRWEYTLAAGWGSGIDVNSRLDKLELRAGAMRRFAPSLSAGLELAAVRFEGTRGGVIADATGVTALPLARWHFLRLGESSCAFEFGFGGARFARPFPPGGTRWNGYSAWGLGADLDLGRGVAVAGGVRFLHHSNGRGLVTDNPAYDGLSFHVGLRYAR